MPVRRARFPLVSNRTQNFLPASPPSSARHTFAPRQPFTRNAPTPAIMLTERSIVGNFTKRLTSWYIRLFQRLTTLPIVAPLVSGVRIRRPHPDFSAECHFALYLRLFQQHCDDSSSRRVELRHGSHRSFVRKN